jgi:hypothetical protein
MLDLSNECMLIASVPPVQVIRSLCAKLGLPAMSRDVHLAYRGPSSLRLDGFLITTFEDINHLVAYCPIHGDVTVGSALWRHDVARQAQVAATIARDYLSCSSDALWFDLRPTRGIQIPTWVFSLACVPLRERQSSELEYPVPFCPQLFQAMASRPEAAEWLSERCRDPWSSQ